MASISLTHELIDVEESESDRKRDEREKDGGERERIKNNDVEEWYNKYVYYIIRNVEYTYPSFI